MSRLSGKVAVITGAGAGLGAAIARRMGFEGAQVFLLDVQPSAELTDELRSAGVVASSMVCDVTSEAEVEFSLKEVSRAAGKIDILVNNAGVEGADKTSDLYDSTEWDRVFSVNCKGPFLCTKHAVQHMRKTGGGSIVNISSIYGLVGAGNVSAYHASKGAVRAMSQNDAISFANDGVRVNTIFPGFIPTSMVERFASSSGLALDDIKPDLDEAHPLGGMGTPDDIAWAAVYLASDEARWVTGAELVVDGGYTSR